MTEAELSKYLTKKATEKGWLCLKLDTSHRGMPDKILIKAGKVIFVEVKSPERRKAPSPLQLHMHELLRSQGLEVYVVYDKSDIVFI